MSSQEEKDQAKKYRIMKRRMDKANSPVCFMIGLICSLYNALCIIFWLAVSGMPNAIDDSPGLPLSYDIIMALSMFLVSVSGMVCVRIIRSWLPPSKKATKNKSTWESWTDGEMDLPQSVRSTR
jgi:threonine/homoserine/homoserine lactone efflux protein